MRSATFQPAIIFSAVLAASLALSACEAPPPVELGEQSQGGLTPLGSGDDAATEDTALETGSETGTETASAGPAATGSLLSAGAGARIGAALVDDDARYFEQAELAARNGPVGSTVTWRNPSTGTVGTVTPLSDRMIGGQDCRDFFLTATIGGRQHSESATACRTGDGWTTRA